MLLRSGRIVICPELVNNQLRYWKQQTMLYLDKLQFLPRDHPLHIHCGQTIHLYQTIMAETKLKFSGNPYFSKEILLEVSARIDEELILSLIKLYRSLKSENYPDSNIRRKSHRLLHNNCTICLHPIQSGMITQSCHGSKPHYFHRECLVKWMISDCANSNRCPVCLSDINQKCLWKVI
jgi:hypothetical protein